MRVWIVNPFDPLPGDPEQEGRYATLARLLVTRGHCVTWWTSSFSHRFKRPVDRAAIRTACSSLGIDVEFLSAAPYYHNMGLRRLRNHAQLATDFRRRAPHCAPRPHTIVVSSPPPVLAAAATDVAGALGAKCLLDVQDLWPDGFAKLLPHPLRPLLRPLFWRMVQHIRRSSTGCDAIVGVADAYVESAVRAAAGCPAKPTATIPLGIDLAAFDAAVRLGTCERFTKPAGEIWLAYTGSLNQAYDFETILHSATHVGSRHGTCVRFFLTGRGDRASRAERLVRSGNLGNVTLTGFLDFPAWAYLLTQCDAGFNACFPDALIFLPNKVFSYLAAGVAVLNTVPGQCSQIVREGGCGLDYRAGDVGSCVAAIERVVNDQAARESMRLSARRLAESDYDRAILFPNYAELIERLGAPPAG